MPAKITGELNILVSSASGSDAGFKAVNEAFAGHPDVKINFTAVPNENYNQARGCAQRRHHRRRPGQPASVAQLRAREQQGR